jgi:serine protease Do
MLNSYFSSVVSGAVGALLAVAAVFSWQHYHPALILPGIVTTPPASPSSGEEQQVISVVKKTNPAVVSIVISQLVPVYEQVNPNNQMPDFFNDPFNFLQQPQYQQKGTQQQDVGAGSGFLISADGLIITNKHVVAQASADYTVFLNDGSKHTAKVIAKDPSNAIAILKIDGKDLPFLEFGSSTDVQIGQTVIAIGNPLGQFRNTVSKGVISGLSRSITAGDASGSSEQLTGVIQTDAAINPGNSGGPLIDLNGRVIGVNVAVAEGSQSIGFALPANGVKSVVESVRKSGHIVRPYLGVRYTLITPAIKQANNLSVDYGALVIRGDQQSDLAIVPGSPAGKAGLVEGDIILEADGQKITETNPLAAAISQKQVGDTVNLKILHQGQTKNVNVKLEEIPQ